MSENSIKFRTSHKEWRFEYRYGDDAFFFVRKTAGLDPEQILVFPALITYTEKLYHPKVVSFWKHYKNSAWQKQNLNVKNWKTGRSEIYEGNRSKDKIEYHRNWRVIKKLTKTLFHGTFFLNTGLSRTTMKNSLALLQKILKEVTYSSIF